MCDVIFEKYLWTSASFYVPSSRLIDFFFQQVIIYGSNNDDIFYVGH